LGSAAANPLPRNIFHFARRFDLASYHRRITSLQSLASKRGSMSARRFASHYSHVRFPLTVAGAALLIAALTQGSGAQPAKKQPATGLEGSWSGGGAVIFASGSREQARCRAHYRRAGVGYTVNATCATASGRAAQTATLRQVGENRYSGSFYNSEYGISGVMHVVVRGSNQTVRLSSSSASAVLHLSR
jgi:hypothetical protein